MFNLKTASSDVLLRPDIALLLPLLTATNPSLLLLSTALLPLKWASGCSCFTALCTRKKTSRLHAYLIFLFLLIAHLKSVHIPAWLPIVVAMATPESLDTKFLKLCMILSGSIMPYGVVLAAAVMLTYVRMAGYKIRLNDSWELLLSNDEWLITRDVRLAKRVNQAGEFHVEVLDGGKARLMGDGRLVGAAKTVHEISVDRFDAPNLDVVKKATNKGRAKMENGVVTIVRQ